MRRLAPILLMVLLVSCDLVLTEPLGNDLCDAQTCTDR